MLNECYLVNIVPKYNYQVLVLRFVLIYYFIVLLYNILEAHLESFTLHLFDIF